ncbi:MAG: cupredoxin domain-containing protein [Candidatus Xenobia bacterium]
MKLLTLLLLLTTLAFASVRPVVIHLTNRTMYVSEVPSEHEKVHPLDLTVPAGTVVCWTVDEGKHEIVAEDHSFHSEVLTEGMQFQHTFDHAGTWAFYDMFHLGGPQKALAGTIRVTGSSPPASR